MLKGLKISAEAMKDGDASLLEDLILAAVGEAQRESETEMNEKLAKITGGFSMPF
jgi:DNA-binding protein YbaB